MQFTVSIRETIKKDIEINELNRNMIYDRPLRRCFIHLSELVATMTLQSETIMCTEKEVESRYK